MGSGPACNLRFCGALLEEVGLRAYVAFSYCLFKKEKNISETKLGVLAVFAKISASSLNQ